MSKFICISCEKIHNIGLFSVAIVNGEKQYRCYRSKEQLICDCDAKGILKSVDVPIDYGSKSISIGTFNSMSIEQKQDLLKKRSSAHFQREIKESKHEMLKATVKQMTGK